MIAVGNALISEDILERKFACQIQKCHGACCIQGDAGAPLDEEEIAIIETELPNIIPYMDSAGKEYMDVYGFHTIDSDGDLGTVCRPSGECVFVVYTNNIVVCAIEKAWAENKTWFRKPLSCHLYPIRAKKYGEFVAMNYHNWDICSDACKAGEEMQVPVYQFLREALVRKMGPAWYGELEEVAKAWKLKQP